jgi:hypothetical protein
MAVLCAIVSVCCSSSREEVALADGLSLPYGVQDDAGSLFAEDSQEALDGVVMAADSAAQDAAQVSKLCLAGQRRCSGIMLSTCTPSGDGWMISPCFPGQVCEQGKCVPLANNLIIVFDTSGSMGAVVKGKNCNKQVFPKCDPSKGCSRMAASKLVFSAVLNKISVQTTRMALFRFPQRVARLTATSCNFGHYLGVQKMTTDTADIQHVDSGSAWYWHAIDQILAVPFPASPQAVQKQKLEILKWMDGKEQLVKTQIKCQNPWNSCKVDGKCGAGGCCGGACWDHIEQPELRASGGTPIGKTLFYVGEYLRNKVVVDGLACIVDGDCHNPNYRCSKGRCTDPARDCRQNVVVLFTDGGQSNDPADFFAPQVSAKRLAYGLGCKVDPDCVGGAVCQAGRCLPKTMSSHVCLPTGAPCMPGVIDPQSPQYCPPTAAKGDSCLANPLKVLTAKAVDEQDNVLRSPDGRAFSVRLHVVDISEATVLTKSFYLSIAGRGRLMTAAAADPDAFIATLTSAFDMKNEKVCGNKD